MYLCIHRVQQSVCKSEPFHSEGILGETRVQYRVRERVLRFAKNGSYVIRIDWSAKAIDWNPVCPSTSALHPNYLFSPIYLRVSPRSRNISPEVITRVDSGLRQLQKWLHFSHRDDLLKFLIVRMSRNSR